MPKDSWKRANDAQRYGPIGRPSPCRKQKRKRKGHKKHTYVSVGSCLVVDFTPLAVEFTMPDGLNRWIPRSVIRNGNARFIPGQVLPVFTDQWFAAKTSLKSDSVALSENP